MASSVRNTAIKRIQGDVREMMKDPSDQYYAAPLEDNMFDWHFTLRGPPDTEFEGGIYHGRILLPADYPFKPPNIMLLTPNGRFEVRKKICLSISAHHPEEWQPAWGIRLILEALISFMPTKGEGAIGAIDYPPEERKRLAKLSCDYTCDVCGKVAELLPELKEEDEENASKPSKYADQIAQLHMHSLESKPATSAEDTAQESKTEGGEAPSNPTPDATTDVQGDASTSAAPGTAEPPFVAPVEEAPIAEVADVAPVAAPVEFVQPVEVVNNAPDTREPDAVDTFLHYVTVALAVALFALVYKRLLQWQGVL
ncbi:hypothetical protein Poli38472_003896 [Pythium oligandrum]|uniref:UBC core domain-containing protein n=1 Tax=Pythium oligandrum TaxID=41045 RepID=A0A8K1CP11_PYTOL|nr:hypothetical protein Poli38472_003896 [Pythium oligandrum]|eukprot:TMW66131.1 hypothetical protein Poli38472_003896 [Pythium oligandrum]